MCVCLVEGADASGLAMAIGSDDISAIVTIMLMIVVVVLCWVE